MCFHLRKEKRTYVKTQILTNNVLIKEHYNTYFIYIFLLILLILYFQKFMVVNLSSNIHEFCVHSHLLRNCHRVQEKNLFDSRQFMKTSYYYFKFIKNI